MSLIDELKQLKEQWPTLSLPLKLFVVFGIFVSVSSIASLADYVFKWKGFILDAIEVYRRFVAGPLAAIGDAIGLDYSPSEVDMLVAAGVFWGTSVRVHAWRYRKDSDGEHLFQIAVAIFAFLSQAYTHGRSTLPSPFQHLFVILYFLVLLWIAVSAWRNDRSAFYSAFGPLGIAAAVVLLLGAINAGLHRTS